MCWPARVIRKVTWYWHNSSITTKKGHPVKRVAFLIGMHKVKHLLTFTTYYFYRQSISLQNLASTADGNESPSLILGTAMCTVFDKEERPNDGEEHGAEAQ